MSAVWKVSQALRRLSWKPSKRQANSDPTSTELQFLGLKLQVKMDRSLKPEQGHDCNSLCACEDTANIILNTECPIVLGSLNQPWIAHIIGSLRGGGD